MAARGCERNVITFSSLISACERAGRCDIALRLFEEMRREGCRPNVVTYNGLIGACAQGERACQRIGGCGRMGTWAGCGVWGRRRAQGTGAECSARTQRGQWRAWLAMQDTLQQREHVFATRDFLCWQESLAQLSRSSPSVWVQPACGPRPPRSLTPCWPLAAAPTPSPFRCWWPPMSASASGGAACRCAGLLRSGPACPPARLPAARLDSLSCVHPA